MISFSKSVKQELCKLRLRGADVRRAQLMGLTHACAALLLGGSMRLTYTTEQHDAGKLAAALATSLYEVDAALALHESGRTKITTVTLDGPGIERLLCDAGLFLRTEEGVELTSAVPEALLMRADCKRAFLRGVFLGAGAIVNPARAYHLEIVCRQEALAETIGAILAEFSFDAKMVRRKQKTVVYLKEGDSIAMLLTLLGASGATLRFEDARTQKDLRNYINRANNCDTANIGKTVDAAARQIEAITCILRNPRARKRLSPKLLEAAELRLSHPEMSLTELGELSGLGKSGINHRLQRLMALAESL